MSVTVYQKEYECEQRGVYTSPWLPQSEQNIVHNQHFLKYLPWNARSQEEDLGSKLVTHLVPRDQTIGCES